MKRGLRTGDRSRKASKIARSPLPGRREGRNNRGGRIEPPRARRDLTRPGPTGRPPCAPPPAAKKGPGMMAEHRLRFDPRPCLVLSLALGGGFRTGRGAVRRDRLRPPGPADPLEQLLQVPRARRRGAPGRAPARPPRRGARSRPSRASRRSSPASPAESQLVRRIFSAKPGLVMPPAREQQDALGGREADCSRPGSRRAPTYQTHWSFAAAERARRRRRSRMRRLAAQRRSTASSSPGSRRKG